MGLNVRSKTVARRDSKSFDIWWDRNKKFLYKTSFERKRGDTEFLRTPGGDNNSRQVI
jgi:hypothetical protein